MKFKKFTALLLTATLAVGMQAVTFGTAHAADNTDLVLTAERNFANQSIGYKVCNKGLTPIKSITFSIDATNIEYETSLISPFDAQPSIVGEIDHDTLTWTGLLDGEDRTDSENILTQCISLIASGNDTGVLGDTVTTTVSIASSIQSDDTVNVDNSGNETVVLDPYEIVELPDLQAESYLIPGDEITPTSEVEYGINVTNVGDGLYHENGFFIFAFTLPPDASFVSATDLAPSDDLHADNLNCFEAGILGETILLPGLTGFAGRKVVLCNLSTTDGTLPADDTVYPFKIKIVAGESLASGTADVIGILEGNDPDTRKLFEILARGDELIDSIASAPNDNIFYLEYDPEALQATSSLCPGQSATTTDGTGCFRITFNKKIYAPSFLEEQINLGGVGSISSFTQIDDFSWEVRVSGIPRGSAVTLLLDLNEIQDYSGFQNSTQVLGVNTIRFADTASSGGSLPETGANGVLALYSATLLLAGFSLLTISRRRKVSI